MACARKQVLKRFEMLFAVYPFWKHGASMSGIWLCPRFFGLELTACFCPPTGMLKIKNKQTNKKNNFWFISNLSRGPTLFKHLTEHVF